MNSRGTISSSALLLSVALILVSCKPSPVPLKPSSTQSILRGTLLAHNGSHLKMGHLTFRETTHPIQEDGSFEVALPRHELVDILFTGVDHQGLTLRIFAEAAEIKLHLQLGTHTRVDSPQNLKLLLGTRDIKTEKYVAYEIYDLQATTNERFETTIPILDGVIYYQISRALKDKRRTVNGTLSTGFDYDGAGDYMSQLQVTAPEQRIVWDPKLLPPSDQAPTLRFEDPKSLAAQTANLCAEWQQYEKKRFNKKSQTTHSPTAWRTKIQKRLLQTNDTAFRHALVMAYFALPLSPGEVESAQLETKKWLKLAHETLPANTPLWTLFPNSLGEIAQSNPYSFYERIIAGTEDVELAGNLMYRLLQYAKLKKDSDRQSRYLKALEDRYLATKAGKAFVQFKSRYLPPHPLQVGQPMPTFDLSLYPQNSTRLTPTSYLGSYWLLDGWATWCDPCILGMPTLHQLHQEFAPKGLKVVSVAVNQSEAAFGQNRKKWPMPWDHAMVSDEPAEAFLQLFAPTGLPTYILVAPNGKILAIKNSLEAGYIQERLRQELK